MVLYRLDKNNVLIRDERNDTGMATGVHKDHINVMSIEFYQYLQKVDVRKSYHIRECRYMMFILDKLN